MLDARQGDGDERGADEMRDWAEEAVERVKIG